MYVLIIATYALIFIYEFVPLYKEKLWRDLLINGFLGLFSFTIAILLCFNVRIPSPAGPIREFITSMFGK